RSCTRPAPPCPYTLSLHDALPICFAYRSTRRASLDRPVTRPVGPGMYPTCATPWNDTRWCSQVEYIGMSRTRTSSWCPSSKVVRSEEHTSELQSRENLVCRLLLEK